MHKLPLLLALPLAVLAPVVGPGAFAAPSSPSPAQPAPVPESARDAVQRLLDQEFGQDRLQARLRGGAVAISGNVDSLVARRRALDAASSVRGVAEVIDELSVHPPARPDDAIERDVKAALDTEPALDAGAVTATVHQGAVALGGFVPSWQARQLAEWTTEKVRGVRTIANRIHIESAHSPDNYIRDEVLQRLRSDPLVNDDHLTVQVQGGDVRLRGEVDSPLEKNYAESDAWVRGATAVDVEQVKVLPPQDRVDDTGRPAAASDEDIREAVKKEFVYDTRVASDQPEVSVHDGVVSLSGTVSTLRAKGAAEQVARNVAGVRRVENQLTVAASDRSDAEVRQEIRDSLLRNPLVTEHQVDVSVNNHRATLTGTVNTALERWAAEDVAAQVVGVASVDNQLRVSGQPQPDVVTGNFHYPSRNAYIPWISSVAQHKSDGELVRDIRHQLRWSPYVNAQAIVVDAAGGVVTLTGRVRTDLERRAAEDNAYAAGARRVANHLTVGPAASSAALGSARTPAGRGDRRPPSP